MSGAFAKTEDAFQRQRPKGGSWSRAWPVHMRAEPLLEVRINIISRLMSIALACKPCWRRVTTSRARSAHAANKLNVDHVTSCGM